MDYIIHMIKTISVAKLDEKELSYMEYSKE